MNGAMAATMTAGNSRLGQSLTSDVGGIGTSKCLKPVVGDRQVMPDARSSVRRVRRHFADAQERILTGRFGARSSASRPSEVGQKRSKANGRSR